MRGIHKNCSRTLKSGLLLAIAFAPFFLQATTLIHAGKLIDGKFSAIFEIIHDRAEAITRVVEMAVPGDTVLLAGKGHERTIEFSEDVQPWNEREVAESLLQSLGYRSDV